MSATSLPRVIVIGANVYGFTTAILLLQKGYKVTLISSSFPGDTNYTNHWSSLHWKTRASTLDTSLQHYDITTFNILMKLAKCRASEAGVMIADAFKYYQDSSLNSHSNPWWKHFVPSYQTIHKKDLPKNMQAGFYYTTVLVNPKRYIGWLQAQFLAMGGKRRRSTLSNVIDAINEVEHANIIVNCCSSLGMEQKLNPLTKRIQQRWTINAPAVRKSVEIKTKDNQFYYVYPRMDGTVSIGMVQKDDSSKHYHNHHKIDAHQILKTISEYCPELTWGGRGLKSSDILNQEELTEILSEHGPRIENQFIATPLGSKIAITHNYGHDGFQSSWGSSKRAVQLVSESMAYLQKESENISKLLSRL
ncbi:unnamed protein product [Cunninghamella echinulata]